MTLIEQPIGTNRGGFPMPYRRPPDQPQHDTQPATSEQLDAHATLVALLRNYGLEGLADWAWERIVAGDNESQIVLSMYEQPEFRTRFPAIDARRSAGLTPMSPAEYIAYERTAMQMMRAAGLPPGYYDRTDDITQLLVGDVSVAELADRISNGYVQVAQAPPQVRAAFADYYGPDGDGALAAFFMDPDIATPVLRQRVAAAQISGRGTIAGFDLEQTRAEELAGLGVTGDQAADAFGRLSGMRGLFTETVGESVNLTAEREGLDATLLGDDRELRRRAAARAAAFSGGGGAYLTGEGAAGGSGY